MARKRKTKGTKQPLSAFKKASPTPLVVSSGTVSHPHTGGKVKFQSRTTPAPVIVQPDNPKVYY